MGFVPELAPVANSIKRIDDDRGSRLTVEFNGKMIPWELLPSSDQFDEEVMEVLKNVLLDGGKPLAALQHIGGEPMMMVVTRMQDHPEYFGLMRQIVQRFKTQLDRAFKID